MRSRPGAARTILLSHIISARPSKQPLMVRTFLKVYMELGSYFLFLQEQIKDIIITKEPTTDGKARRREGGSASQTTVGVGSLIKLIKWITQSRRGD